MKNPNGVVLDPATDRLYVGDTGNHRVTTYDVAAITNGENAVNVLGQVNFTSGTAATTQGRMSSPRGLALVPPDVVVTTSITYDYDPLYRLTAADYAGGTFFHYTYDAVGNRLTEVTQAGSTNYTYDNANRLTLVNGVTNTWDNRGNLLSDGVSTYNYDRANRLISAVQGANTYAFAYNGLGDRLWQTVNGVPTNYSVDVTGGLTQVLSDGSNNNLYGPDLATGQGYRIGEEQSGGWEYHLPDPLMSSRQLVDAPGAVDLSRSFQPFGSVLTTSGTGASAFGFTGEQRDGTGLVFLRARYLSPVIGRFITRDPWTPGQDDPQIHNSWVYARNDPLTRVDASGMFSVQCAPSQGVGLCIVWTDEFEVCLPFDGCIVVRLPFAKPMLVPCEEARLFQPIARRQEQTKTRARAPVVVQLQEGFIHHASEQLPDSGDGVVVAQVLTALTHLASHPSITRRYTLDARLAQASASVWAMSRPPSGVPAGHYKFPFPRYPDWRFDIVVYFGRHLKE